MSFTSAKAAKVPGLRAAAQWHHAEDVGQDLNKAQKVAKNGALSNFFGQWKKCILTSYGYIDTYGYKYGSQDTNMGYPMSILNVSYMWIHPFTHMF